MRTTIDIDDPILKKIKAIQARDGRSLGRLVSDLLAQALAFTWQEGYSVFSVSKSQEPVVKSYIARQAAHHRKETFKSELLRLLRAHEVEFDQRYVFD